MTGDAASGWDPLAVLALVQLGALILVSAWLGIWVAIRGRQLRDAEGRACILAQEVDRLQRAAASAGYKTGLDKEDTDALLADHLRGRADRSAGGTGAPAP